MRLENETFELDLIARALQTISKEVSYGGLAKAVLEAALRYSGADRGAVLLSEGGELLSKVDPSFPLEKAKFLVKTASRRTAIFRRAQRKGAHAPGNRRQQGRLDGPRRERFRTAERSLFVPAFHSSRADDRYSLPGI